MGDWIERVLHPEIPCTYFLRHRSQPRTLTAKYVEDKKFVASSATATIRTHGTNKLNLKMTFAGSGSYQEKVFMMILNAAELSRQ